MLIRPKMERGWRREGWTQFVRSLYDHTKLMQTNKSGKENDPIEISPGGRAGGWVGGWVPGDGFFDSVCRSASSSCINYGIDWV